MTRKQRIDRTIREMVAGNEDARPGSRIRGSALRAGLEQSGEDLTSRTLRPATVAALLEVSRPTLQRWLDLGEIASVLTREGRREVPLTEVLGLLDEVDAARAQGAQRAISAVIKQRRRDASEAVDIDRLLPRGPRGHRSAELHALAYHRLIAERLDDEKVLRAQERLERMRDEGKIHPTWARRWKRVLALPAHDVARVISEDGPRSRDLRQSSPFAGLLTEQERRYLFAAVEQRGVG